MMTTPQLMRLKKSSSFSDRLNEYIFTMIELLKIEYVVSDENMTEEEILSQDLTKPLKVWSGGSESTIFGNKEVNYAFRAWHDYIHIKCKLSFSPTDEARVAFIQAAMLPEEWTFERNLILIEVIGQVLYHEENDEFVEDQRAFTISMIDKGYHNKQ